ncbi:MAG: hypothetical protein WCX70_02025 [Candidatus Paceibacterota bacterium]|jgi:hypothetical protein
MVTLARTRFGVYIQDPSGNWHYFCTYFLASVRIAVKDAINHKPKGPTCFWLGGTISPLEENDNESSLFIRWKEWRQSFVFFPEILEALLEYTGISQYSQFQ